jgi:hypothetical protein
MLLIRRNGETSAEVMGLVVGSQDPPAKRPGTRQPVAPEPRPGTVSHNLEETGLVLDTVS